MKTVLAPAALLAVLLGTLLGGCGGPPTDASKAEFCGVLADFYDDTAQMGSTDTRAAVAALKRVADRLEEVGTPSDVPDSARVGFERTIERIQGLSDDASPADLELSSEEQEYADAFGRYVRAECPETATSVD